MKNLITLLITLALSSLLKAQNETHFTRRSSQPPVTDSVKERIKRIPLFQPTERYTKEIVSFIDNSTSRFFPPIFNQKGNSCSQASGIRYMFTYHINALRSISSNSNSNIYSYHYTWNFLNEGTDMGSWYFDGFDLVMCNGAPTLSDFPDDSYSINQRTWMTGYDKYHRAMHNRIESYHRIDAGAQNGLDNIKRVLIDQGDESEAGGLIVFSGKTSGWELSTYNGSSNTGYNTIITSFGSGGDHAMLIVGFDDNVEFDLNNDGEIQEDERGALIIVNSWGVGWGHNGRAYMPYKLLDLSTWSGGIGNADKYVYGIKAMEHTPTVTARVRIKYTSRNDLWFILGVANDPNAENQQQSKITKVFSKQGGDYFMLGGNSESDKTIEIGFDYTDLLKLYPEAKKFFLTVKQAPIGTLGNGEVISYKINDYRYDDPMEYESSHKNVTINGSNTLYASATASSANNTLLPANKPIVISPNPASGGERIALDIPCDSPIITARIFSINGAKILVRQNIAVEHGRAYLTLPPNLLPGAFLVLVQTKNSIWRERLIVN